MKCKTCGRDIPDNDTERMVDILTGERLPFCDESCSEAAQQ